MYKSSFGILEFKEKIIEDLSTLKSEKEVLFKSNTKFEVKDIRESTSPEDFISKIKTIELIEK